MACASACFMSMHSSTLGPCALSMCALLGITGSACTVQFDGYTVALLLRLVCMRQGMHQSA